MHHTKDKGDFAVAKVIVDLMSKGFATLSPTISEHLRFDIVAFKDNKFIRIQVKYCGNETNSIFLKSHTTHRDKTSIIRKKYKEEDFDYYAIYSTKKDIVLYPSIKFSGKYISVEVPNSASMFYWYEDFLNFTNEAQKRTYKEFGIELTKRSTNKTVEAALNRRKVERPTKEVLEKLIWEQPTSHISKTFGVSDKAIEKWCKSYCISKPPRGYWRKNENKKIQG